MIRALIFSVPFLSRKKEQKKTAQQGVKNVKNF